MANVDPNTGYPPCVAGECWLGNMVLVKRLYTPGQIDRAGRALIASGASVEASMQAIDAVLITDHWRTAHSHPLELARQSLHARAVSVNPKVIIAERLKRLESITEKLTREPQMRLSTMQDIGGCRAVLRDPREVAELVRAYGDVADLKKTDYVARPRISGYRSTHLIWRFRSQGTSDVSYDKMRIEIQIRTALQHAWATAVEIASTFTGHDLKSDRPKCNDARWVRFFALMGTALAMMEGGPAVPNTPTNEAELIRELRRLAEDLRVQTLMKRWSSLTNIGGDVSRKKTLDARLFLITLRPWETKWYLKVKAYGASKAQEAADERIRLEKESRECPEYRGMQVALVAVESIDILRRAYPNYYADTTEFLKVLQTVLYGSAPLSCLAEDFAPLGLIRVVQ
jgi:hypothetical protein